jgi:luciferase family oxidoreductase group 1
LYVLRYVIDQSPVPGKPQSLSAVALSTRLARACDRAGYSRYWVAEHHNSINFAGPSPEILISHIATITEHLRVGSGGVMLPHYSPDKVAEQFKVLVSLFPGRIDLGIGRAPGGDGWPVMRWPIPMPRRGKITTPGRRPCSKVF